MKLILLVLILTIGCGKKEKPLDPHYVSPVEAMEDSDGDGLSDWDERYVGRDPLLAELDETLPPPSEEGSLIEANMLEQVLPVTTLRSLRVSALAQIAGRKTVWPRLAEIQFRFDAHPEFWLKALNRVRFTHYRLPFHRHHSAIELEKNFSGAIRISPPIQEKFLEKIEKKTYRLIISTPEKDFIYRLSTSVAPLTFLATKHSLVFDSHKNLIGIDQWNQLVPHGHGVNHQDDVMLWSTAGSTADIETQPEAGETLALVFASAKEFKRASLAGIEETESNSQSYTNPWGHEAALTVFLPHARRLQTSVAETAIPIRIGNGDREATCVYLERKQHGMKNFHRGSLSEILQQMKMQNVENPRAEWVVVGTDGIAARINFFARPGVVSFNFRPELFTQTESIGVYRSGCETRVRAKVQSMKTWDALLGSFSWIP
jgi:hypothetical protein